MYYSMIAVDPDIEEFIKNNFIKRKTLNRTRSSYGLKHYVEKRLGRRHGYVSNQELIHAMIHCGFNYEETEPDSPNYYFNVSEKSFRYMTPLEKEQHYGDPEYTDYSK